VNQAVLEKVTRWPGCGLSPTYNQIDGRAPAARRDCGCWCASGRQENRRLRTLRLLLSRKFSPAFADCWWAVGDSNPGPA